MFVIPRQNHELSTLSTHVRTTRAVFPEVLQQGTSDTTLIGMSKEVPFATCRNLSGRHYVVTGCGPGSIGEATAAALASWGAQVLVTTRKHSATAAARISTMSGVDSVYGTDLELTNRESVADAAAAVHQFSPHGIDGLIASAGVHLDLLSRWDTPRLADGHEVHWRINFLGTVDFATKLMPLLMNTAMETGDARITVISSQLHTRGIIDGLEGTLPAYNSWDAYGTSKLAISAWAREVHRRYSELGLSACSLHPGAVKTAVAAKGLAESPLISAARALAAPLEKRSLLTPTEGAQTPLYCATDRNLDRGKNAPTWYVRNEPREPHPAVNDEAIGSAVWATAHRWINPDWVDTDASRD